MGKDTSTKSQEYRGMNKETLIKELEVRDGIIKRGMEANQKLRRDIVRLQNQIEELEYKVSYWRVHSWITNQDPPTLRVERPKNDDSR